MSINAPRFDGYSPIDEYLDESGERFVEYRIGNAELLLARAGLARIADSDEFYLSLLQDMMDVATHKSTPEGMEDFQIFSEGDIGEIYQHELEEGALWTGKFGTLFVNFVHGNRDKLSAFATARGLARQPVVVLEAMSDEELSTFTDELQPATLAQLRLTTARLTSTRPRRASKE